MKSKLLLLGLFCLLASSVTIVRCQDATEDESEGTVDEEHIDADNEAIAKDLDEEDDVSELKPSEDAEVTFLFTRPISSKDNVEQVVKERTVMGMSRAQQRHFNDLPAGSIVKFLVGFYNKGFKEFTVNTLEASFRYPQDYSFYINNYTAAQFHRTVGPGHESTFDYAFMPSDTYAGRPLGLVVNLRYSDVDGNVYENAVFNATVNIVEDESAFNPETYFLYLVFAAVLVLLLLLGRDFLAKMRRKHGVSKKSSPTMEVGTSKEEIDFEWIPKDTLQHHNNKSPGRSPRNRKAQRRTAGDD